MGAGRGARCGIGLKVAVPSHSVPASPVLRVAAPAPTSRTKINDLNSRCTTGWLVRGSELSLRHKARWKPGGFSPREFFIFFHRQFKHQNTHFLGHGGLHRKRGRELLTTRSLLPQSIVNNSIVAPQRAHTVHARYQIQRCGRSFRRHRNSLGNSQLHAPKRHGSLSEQKAKCASQAEACASRPIRLLRAPLED